MLQDPRGFLIGLFEQAVSAVSPARCVPGRLPPPPSGRTVILGAGKAAAAMARAVEEHWDDPLEGLVVTRYGHGLPCARIEVVEAAHPVPDAAGRAAAARILEAARGLGEEDLCLCLFSGGGSALLALPAPGITLEDKQALTRALLLSGAGISEINCVRRHLSAVKGGRLAAAAAPARVVALLISDVPGDDPAAIASGPTVADLTTFADALGVLERYGIDPPARVRLHLERGEDETPKPGDPRLAGSRVALLAASRDALEAAAAAALRGGIVPVVLGDDLEGDAGEVARAQAGLALRAARGEGAARPPCVLLSGGETTVKVSGGGRGGPNAQYLLALALALEGHPGIHALACDTDGIDGTGDNAGCCLAPDTLERAAAAGWDPTRSLADNDAYGLFRALGDLVVTGPTRTNVNDFRAILIVEGSDGV